MLDELLNELEAVTDSLLKRSSCSEFWDTGELDAEIRHRAAVIHKLSAGLQSSRRLHYTDYNRLIIVQFKGEQIQRTLRKVRTRIAADLNSGSRDRMLVQRIAAQLSRNS